MRSGLRAAGFTLIELMVVLAIIAMLVAIVSPRYFHGVERARLTSLQTTLATVRDAIDKFEADQARYPSSLEELVSRRYLREVPLDPVTGRRDTWILVEGVADDAPISAKVDAASVLAAEPGIQDLHSGATGISANGTPYADY